MKNKPRVPRPPRAPSPYMRYGKMPYKYSRIGDRTQTLPPEVERELARARVRAAAWVEAQLAQMDPEDELDLAA